MENQNILKTKVLLKKQIKIIENTLNGFKRKNRKMEQRLEIYAVDEKLYYHHSTKHIHHIKRC